MNRILLAAALSTALSVVTSGAAWADAAADLKTFAAEARTGRASFTQTVTSPDGARTKRSSGTFEFSRPNRFRFQYTQPFEQLIVGDGQKVWLYDRDLNQVTVRRLDQGLGATPAALLAGGAPEKDFVLATQPDRDGLSWVQATPRAADGTVQSLRVAFRGSVLVAVEILDSFGQRTALQFSSLALNGPSNDDSFRFVPPAGADVVGP